jgi:hypothetical protein
MAEGARFCRFLTAVSVAERHARASRRVPKLRLSFLPTRADHTDAS